MSKYPTGPAPTPEEALAMARTLSSEQWKTGLGLYLKRRQDDALQRVMGRIEAGEHNLYYKAVYNIIDEILGLPESLSRQIKAMREQDEES